MNNEQLHELLYQALETEQGGIAVYDTAIKCAVNDDLRSEWEEYLEQTRHHEQVIQTLFNEIGLDPSVDTPGRVVVRHIGESLVAAMEMALASGPPEAAQLVAGECVVNAETKDHLNWELMTIGGGEDVRDQQPRRSRRACDEVEDEEDEHLYHTMGWTRELWMESLGMPAVLPPPEEQKGVKTAIGAAKGEERS